MKTLLFIIAFIATVGSANADAVSFTRDQVTSFEDALEASLRSCDFVTADRIGSALVAHYESAGKMIPLRVINPLSAYICAE